MADSVEGMFAKSCVHCRGWGVGVGGVGWGGEGSWGGGVRTGMGLLRCSAGTV